VRKRDGNLFFAAFYYIVVYRPDVVISCPDSVFVLSPIGICRKILPFEFDLITDIRTIPVELSGVTGKLKDIVFSISLKLTGKCFDGLTVISPFMRKMIARKMNLDEEKIGIWRSGVSTEHFDPCSPSWLMMKGLKKELGLADKFILIYHGSLSANRGIDETIKAVDIVKNLYPDIGGGASRNALDDLIKKLGIEAHVKLVDSVSYEQIPFFLAISDIGILPFPNLLWWRVSSPIKLLEYMAMEKPIIATEIEAHRDVLRSGSHAVFVSSNHPAEMARAIIWSRKNRTRLKKCGKEGRKIVETEYTWDHQAEKLEYYLNSLKSRKNDMLG